MLMLTEFIRHTLPDNTLTKIMTIDNLRELNPIIKRYQTKSAGVVVKQWTGVDYLVHTFRTTDTNLRTFHYP